MTGGEVLGSLRRHPERALVAVALLVAIGFADQPAGAVGLTVVVVALGVAAANHGHRLPPWRLGEVGTRRLVLVAVLALLVWTFWNQLRPRGWTLGDYGGQRVALEQLVKELRSGHIPAWSMGLSTGESPFETYPALTYVIAAGAAIATGMEDRLSDVLVIVAIVAHALIVVNVVRVVYRIARPWAAFAIGMILIVDFGSVSAGGIVGTVEWGLVHSAVAQAIGLFAAVAVLDFLARPRLGRVVVIWLATAIATAAHPSALLATAGAVVALGVVALLARDVPARRPAVAALHLCVGAALGAVVWMPLGARLVTYGQHFSNALRSPAKLLEDLLLWAHPPGLFTAIVYLGYVGLVLAVWSRRGRVVFAGALGVLMLLGFLDVPYTFFDLAPSLEAARVGADRFHQLVRPWVFACAGYAMVVLVTHARAAWVGARARDRAIVGAVLAVGIALFVRAAVPLWLDLQARARDYSYHRAPKQGRDELVAWARAQAAQLGPDRYARALFELGGEHYHHHLTADTGLPSFHMGPLPDLLLRERIEDTSPASLRRFNVRWVIERGKSPSLGDPATERVLGDYYYVREIPEWDGQFARIERGAGHVRTVELADERVRVELTGTDAPALVALGMGHYPRWRATAADGRPIKVYAYPTIPGGKLHVVAAWIPPGVTTFTADGPLPSDGRGRGLAGAAAVFACAVVTVWSRRRWRWRALRAIARGRAYLAARTATLRVAACAVAAIAIVAWGLAGRGKPVRALQLGDGLRGFATITAHRTGKPRERCSYGPVTGRYRCHGLASFYDTTDTVLNDAQPLWPYTTPVIRVIADAGQTVEFELKLRRRLAGTYWIGTTGYHLEVQIGDGPWLDTTQQREVTVPDARTTVRVRGYAPASGTSFAFVRADTLVPPRPYLVLPPPEPPANLAP